MGAGLCVWRNRIERQDSLPRFKVPDEQMDIDELENAEFDEESQFKPYTGEQPPKGTILRGLIKKAWLTESGAGASMLKVIFEASEESGKYEGLGVWDNIAFQTNTKFRWFPFLQATGLTLLAIKNRIIFVSDDDDNIGSPIKKIGKDWVVGEDSTAVMIVTKRERRDGEWVTGVDSWLEYEPLDDDEDEEDEDDDDYEEDDEEEEDSEEDEDEGEEDLGDGEEDEEEDLEDYVDEEEEEEPAPPVKPAKRPGTRSAAGKPATPKPTAAKPVRASSAPVKTTARKATAKPVARGRVKGRSTAGYDEEPPF